MSDSTRPDEIEGISTDADGTTGNPELRRASAAPDLSDDAQNPDRPGTKDPASNVSDDVHDIRGDETPGTALNPH